MTTLPKNLFNAKIFDPKIYYNKLLQAINQTQKFIFQSKKYPKK